MERRGALCHRLHLREALRLAEDVRVGHGHHVRGLVEVLARRKLLAQFRFGLLVVEVHAVEAVQDVQEARHGRMEARVNGAEDHHALLEASHRGADRGVGVAVNGVL